MIILWILGYLLLFLLFILGLVIIIPFEYALSGSRYDHYQIKAEIMWLFHLVKISFSKEYQEDVSFSIESFGFRKALDMSGDKNDSPTLHNKKDNKKKKKATIKQKKKKDWKGFINRALFEKVALLIKELMLHMAPKKFECIGSFGFEDPYYTGISWAALYSFAPLLEGYNLHLTPYFEGEKFEGRFYIKGKILVMVLLFYICKLAFSKPARKILFHIIKEEKSYGI